MNLWAVLKSIPVRSPAFLALAIFAFMMLTGSTARAAFSFTLTGASCSCGTSPYGTIRIAQDSVLPATVDITISLNSPYAFHQTQGNSHPSVALNIDVANVTLGNFKLNGTATTMWSVVTGGGTPAGFGTFPYALALTTPKGVNSASGVLTFTATAPSGYSLTPTDFVSNGKAYIVSDIINLTSATTGNVAAVNAPVVTAEPGTLWLMFTAVGLLGFRKRTAKRLDCGRVAVLSCALACLALIAPASAQTASLYSVGNADLAGALQQPPAADAQATPDYQFYAPADALKPDQNDVLIATVDGKNIYLSALQGAREALPAQAWRQPFEMIYPILVQSVIDRTALLLKSEAMHLDQDKAVRRRMREAGERVLVDEYLARAVATQVTVAAMRARYDQLYGHIQQIEEIHLRTIVVPGYAQGAEILRKIQAGEDFATLARAFSIDPSASAGGELGWLRRDQLQPDAAAAAFALRPGETVRQPVADRSGWDIFQAIDRRALPVPDYDAAKAEIRKLLADEVVQREVREARASVTSRIYNLDGTPYRPPEADLMDQAFRLELK